MNEPLKLLEIGMKIFQFLLNILSIICIDSCFIKRTFLFLPKGKVKWGET